MIVIADSNIFYSALVAPRGTIAGILKEKRNIQFLASDYLVEEIQEHASDIAGALGKSRKEVVAELQARLHNVKVIANSDVPKKHVREARDIAKDIDIDDAFFIALHLHTKHKIWSGDKVLINGLTKKGYDICITTNQVKKSLYKV